MRHDVIGLRCWCLQPCGLAPAVVGVGGSIRPVAAVPIHTQEGLRVACPRSVVWHDSTPALVFPAGTTAAHEASAIRVRAGSFRYRGHRGISSPGRQIHERFHERRCDLRDDGVTVSAQASHAGGYPMSQRECAGFRLTPAVRACDLFEPGPYGSIFHRSIGGQLQS